MYQSYIEFKVTTDLNIIQ